MTPFSVRDSLDRWAWTLDRFGLSPRKLPARLFNRSQPRVLSVSIPKAGTHLLERALCLHPRLYRKILPTVNTVNVRRLGDMNRMLARLRPGQILVAHLLWDPAFRGAIESNGASAIFLVRDPRDILVSEAHFVASSPSHRVHRLFARRATLKDMILLSLRGDPEHRMWPMADILGAFEGWLDSGAHVVRFEDLVGHPGGGHDATQHATIHGIFEHLGVTVDDALVSSIGGRLFSKRSPTFRQGSIGTWREVFDDEVRDAFDRSAGRFVERYGYALNG